MLRNTFHVFQNVLHHVDRQGQVKGIGLLIQHQVLHSKLHVAPPNLPEKLVRIGHLVILHVHGQNIPL
jgi:hypothetical protein